MKWNIFSTRNEEPQVVAKTDIAPQKDMRSLIAEIHHSFDTALDDISSVDETLASLAVIGFYELPGAMEERSKDVKRKMKQKYEQLYPNYKYIDEHSVSKICSKYGILLSDVSRYTGTIPEKNRKEIIYFHNTIGKRITEDRLDINNDAWGRYPGYYICAPQEDLLLRSTDQIIDGRVYVKDPIVLFQVIDYSIGEYGYLIVSKWGLEGEDESLTNEKMN